MTHPVETAVAPVKADAIARAEKEAHAHVERLTAELIAAGNDLNIVAPRPRGMISKTEYRSREARCAMFGAITKWRATSHRPGTPLLADVCPERVAKFITNAKEDAAAQYDLFVAKLVGKVGDCETATLEGNHVWGSSYLTVTKAAGAREVWHTQQILNVSKLGKLFNQWPSRKQK